VVVSILRTGYKRAKHRHVIEKTPSPVCPFFGVSLTTEHILWDCTETTTEREREKRNQNHERGMDRWNRRTEKIDRIYEENRIIPWNRNKDYVRKIKN
jgi:hypothetical protein